jgi:hypothetical protein
MTGTAGGEAGRFVPRIEPNDGSSDVEDSPEE